MDGRKPLLRHLFIAALAWTGSTVTSPADDFIRPPVRSDSGASSSSPSASNAERANRTPIVQPSAVTTPAPVVAAPVQPPAQSITPVAPPASQATVPTSIPTAQPAVPTQFQPTARMTLAPTQTSSNDQVFAPRPNPSSNPLGVAPGALIGFPPAGVGSVGTARPAPASVTNAQTQPNDQPLQPVQTHSPNAKPRNRVQANALNWQPRGGRGQMQLSGYSAPAPEASSPNSGLTLTTAAPPTVFVDPQTSAFAEQDLPEVPPAVSANAATAPGMQLVVQPNALDAAQAEELRQRRELAARISDELSVAAPLQGRPAPGSIEPGPGWQAVGDQLRQHLAICEQMLSRKAYLSAVEESNLGIIELVRVLDLRQNQFVSEPAWAQAQQALREAQEFTSVQRIANDAELFTRLIQSHETPTLRNTNVRDLTPLAAAQHYRAYAEKRLVEASQGHPWFSELYYCKGRALQSQAENGHPQADSLLHQALAYYRAANTIQPSNATNANQLGYVLLRMDRPTEALAQLSETVQLPNCPLEAWQNIAQASSRLGDERTQQWAVQNYVSLKSQGAQPSGPVNTLVELDPKQFAVLSPPSVGPHAPFNSSMQYPGQSPMTGYPNGPGMMAPAPAATPAAATPQNRTANTPRFGIFR